MQVLKLGQLCEVLADAVAGANVQLASQSEENRDSFNYRLRAAGVTTEHSISHEALYGRFVHDIREFSFSVPCCVVSRVVGGQRQAVLQLRAPAWWRRLGRKVECRELEIGVDLAHVTLKLHPAPGGRMPKRGLRCVLTLSPEECAALAIEHHTPTETVTFSGKTQPNMD